MCCLQISLTLFAVLFIYLFILVDYYLFEEVKRVAESAQRTRINLFGYSHFKIPFHLQGLRNAAESQDEIPISPQWSVEGEK